MVSSSALRLKVWCAIEIPFFAHRFGFIPSVAGLLPCSIQSLCAAAPDFVYLLPYVDDMLIVGNSSSVREVVDR
jgi:hypothetical protein